MNNKVVVLAACCAGFKALCALASGGELPGDVARPGDNGVPWTDSAPRPVTAPRAPSPPAARAVPVELALEAAQAIAEACKQYPLGIAVVNSEGAPILVYIPHGSEAHHTYTAIRKAYSAVKYQAPTSELRARVAKDSQLAAAVKSDSNLIAFSGGVLLRVSDAVIGAIGVSGAEPGSHDEECALIGSAKISDRLR
jgi:uncharacterized protein GlcG (DUF336 family)